MNLGEWIIERRNRGVSSRGDSAFHQEIKIFTKEDFDDLLRSLVEPTEQTQALAKAVGWLLCQAPGSKSGLWMAHGGYAKKRLIESLAGPKASERKLARLLSLSLSELRIATPNSALETVAKICLGRKYCSLVRLKLKKKMAESDPPYWNSVFSRGKDGEDGLPRFYVRGSRRELCGYDGYLGTHSRLNQILEFLGGNNKHNWVGSDSMFNVATYEYVDSYDPDAEDIDDRLEIYAGNYLGYGKPQGAWVIGFRLFRNLVKHLRLKPPRKLKGE